MQTTLYRLFLLLVVTFACIGHSLFAETSLLTDCGKTVHIKATPKTGYHFIKWSDGNTDSSRSVVVSKAESFLAIFAPDTFTIRFVNYNLVELQNSKVIYNETPAFVGETPQRDATAQYTYTFAAWNPTIVPATKDTVYMATYDSVVNTYKVTFLNWDKQVLEEKEWEYGQTPSYSGTQPAHTIGAYTYTFAGWSPDIAPVTERAAYTAKFDSTENMCTITVDKVGEGNLFGAGEYQYGTTITLTAEAAECYDFAGWNDGNTDATRTVMVTGNATYTATFTVENYTIKVETTTPNWGDVSVDTIAPAQTNHAPANAQAIDLGLPSGTKWANMNIGATKEEDYGDYFAWGETGVKDDYSWLTYSLCNGSYSTITKYCTSSNSGIVDNKEQLDSSDDAAIVNWGGNWRMPTYDELDELRSKCTWTWTQKNGISGHDLKGPNGNRIFLPAAGFRDGTSMSYVGLGGHYWSSLLYLASYQARYLYLYSSYQGMSGNPRSLGYSVRAVQK